MDRPTIAIVGPGRAGSTLARALTASGYYVAAVAGRHPEHAPALAYEGTARPGSTPAAAAALAELVILAVPDDAAAPVAARPAAAGTEGSGQEGGPPRRAPERSV